MRRDIDKQQILQDFARYMAGRYRLGYSYLALYWAAVLFEGIIWEKSGMQAGLNPMMYPEGKEPNLYGLIKGLKDDVLSKDSVWRCRDVFPRYIHKGADGNLTIDNITSLRNVRTRLDNFRHLRNQIMHGISINVLETEFMTYNLDEFVCYVWSELAPESFNKAHAEWRPTDGGRPVHRLSQISADYMVRAIDETCMTESAGRFKGLSRSDFDNMFSLRSGMLALQAKLKGWLRDRYQHFETDILTTIDTTSAYIWMPLVPVQNEVDGARRGIASCSVSILGTPLDFRIYLEFGGRARNEREIFYNFLRSDEYKTYREQNLTGREWQLFDIDWYSAMHNLRPLDTWQDTCDSDITKALNILPPKQQTNPEPITWNRLLHGFIISKFDICKQQPLKFEMISEKLEQVIALHDEFNRYCQTQTNGERL